MTTILAQGRLKSTKFEHQRRATPFSLGRTYSS